ncbi:MAG: Arc family DNA-binding protein [Rhizobium sp.]|nr:Arc family DNA-binding protein [Rhizobium sp.]MBW8319256.1 Arc family DNA-binding protein [Rhizobium sp.]
MARGDFPSAKQDQFMLRFPDGLRDRIKVAAETNGRSMNSEIIARLEDTLITDSYAESLEIHGVKSDLERKAREAAGIQQRLSTIEAKLDQLLALEDHYRADGTSSAARGQAIRKQLSDSVKDHEDGK